MLEPWKIIVGSMGGEGGRGDEDLLKYYPASRGGNAGDVKVTAPGFSLNWAGNRTNEALFTAFSAGGNGGGAYQGVGGGGHAGGVTAEFNQAGYGLRTSGASAAGAWVFSKGGHAGRGGTSYQKTAIDGGGEGGSVTVRARSGFSIATNGDRSPGLIAESLGGNGAVKLNAAFDEPEVTVGGRSGFVYVETQADVRTSGNNSIGLVAQSVGGVGGSQGTSGGWKGLDGGQGGPLEVRSGGKITTEGDYSIGLFAQSAGGTGGRGGGANFASAGGGGRAGNGGRVAADNSSVIQTQGFGATGVVLQSIGGARALDPFASMQPVVDKTTGGGQGGRGGIFSSIGGEGGAGGDGGPVEFSNNGSIETVGHSARGVILQSIGGTGGAGGDAAAGLPFFSLALGGGGGGGGKGGSVNFHAGAAGAKASITTSGDDATALLAQSVGGGGGVGGNARSTAVGFVGAVAVTIGGSGGPGGSGGAVNVDNTSAITTFGADSMGISAMSVGGGGGAGGSASSSAFALPLPKTPAPSMSVALAIGGQGGEGGSGGEVGVKNRGAITTSARNAVGILAISTGGGGGTAGKATSYALAVAPPQKIALDVNVALGGAGGGGGNGGSVTVENAAGASIVTSGNKAIGISAHSIGGGGGKGGGSDATSDLLGLYGNYSVTVGVGGKGGGGGSGHTVRVTNNGSIATSGDFAFGISAQSIGGGGGDAGDAETNSKVGLGFSDLADKAVSLLQQADSMMVNVAVGGSGGNGGNGGSVFVTNAGTIDTVRRNATAIFAQSVGGGGGKGGGFQGGGQGTLNVGVSVGGSGGDGGSGLDVNVKNLRGASIQTQGGGSHAILAQSVGGGGGYGGGFSAAPKMAPEVEDTEKFIFAITKELLKYNTSISDNFDKSIFKKGSNTQNSLKGIKSFMDKYKIWLDKDASVVEKIAKTAFFYALQELQNKFKSQINEFQKNLQPGEAQKMPDLSVKVSVGGSGGGGGVGGAVSVDNAGQIVTKDRLSFGILAQSIGGGGGSGGAAYSDGQNKLNLQVAVGGSGGVGQSGGAVTIANSGAIETFGDISYGLFAQSVGGGGGIGGGASTSSTIALSANVNVGGKGGRGSNGGVVEVKNSGSIITHGREAHALVAQSVGGGGGTFFLNQVDPNDSLSLSAIDEARLLMHNETYVATLAVLEKLGVTPTKPVGFEPSTTILPKPNLAVSIGGSGWTGGNGSDVKVTHSDNPIITTGLGAFGIFAQSIGGGGGFGAAAPVKGNFFERAMNVHMGIGGEGGAAGDGGQVSVVLGSKGSITTEGAGATAIFLQSIGGGGGFGGASESSLSFVKGQTPDYFRRYDNNSGRGGKISVTAARADGVIIATTGERAHGIHAQSLGGGGGAVTTLNGAPMPINTQSAGRRGAAGSGGAIDVDLASATISATGKDAYGVFLQSGRQKGDGTLETTKVGESPDDTAPAATSENELFAGMIWQWELDRVNGPAGSARGKDITVKTAGGIYGGSGTGAAIRIDGGDRNTIEIGSTGVVSALSGTAIIAGHGSETVKNAGLVIGDVDLAATGGRENNVFSNTGTYRSLEDRKGTVNVSLFSNQGTVDIAGVNKIGTLDIKGRYEQGSNGSLIIDIAPGAPRGQTNDVLTVDTARLEGKVLVNLMGNPMPEAYAVIQDSKGSGVDISAVKVEGMQTLPIPVSWVFINPGLPTSRAILVPDPDFTYLERYATRDRSQVAETMRQDWLLEMREAVQVARMPGQYPSWNGPSQRGRGMWAFMLSSMRPEQYAATLSDMTPETTTYAAGVRSMEARANLRAANSCPRFTTTGASLREGDCVWGSVQASYTRLSSSIDEAGFSAHTQAYRIGVQKEYAPNWFIGASAAYLTSNSKDGSEFDKANAQAADVAVALKYELGPWLFSVAGNVGYGSHDNVRSISNGSEHFFAKSNTHTLTLGTKLRGSYQMVFGNWYLRPYLDLDLVHARMPSYMERGAPGLNLEVRAFKDTHVGVSPNLEIGGRVDLPNSMWMRPYATVGFTWLSDSQLITRARLEAGGPEGGFFTTSTHIPNRLGNLGAGVQMGGAFGIDLTAEYQAEIGRKYLSHTGRAKVSVRF